MLSFAAKIVGSEIWFKHFAVWEASVQCPVLIDIMPCSMSTYLSLNVPDRCFFLVFFSSKDTRLQRWMEEDPEKVKEEIVMLEHKAEEELKPVSEKTHLKPW